MRKGGRHSIWCNPQNGAMEAVPRHSEIANKLAMKICRGLGVPNTEA
jgi:mRNA interferase HicA